MLPIAWWACRSCSTRARRSASAAQASSKKAGHAAGSRSRAARNTVLAWSSVAVMESSADARHLYQSVRNGPAGFLTTGKELFREAPLSGLLSFHSHLLLAQQRLRLAEEDLD